MFREIRLKDRAVNEVRTVKILAEGSYGVLSTIGKDGYPYGVPLNYTYADNCIFLHCAQQGHKLDNIDFNNSVSFCVVTRSAILDNEFDTDYESAIAFGKAIVVTDDQEKSDVLLSMLNKYSPDHLRAGKNYMRKNWDETRVIRIEIEHLSGKAHE